MVAMLVKARATSFTILLKGEEWQAQASAEEDTEPVRLHAPVCVRRDCRQRGRTALPGLRAEHGPGRWPDTLDQLLAEAALARITGIILPAVRPLSGVDMLWRELLRSGPGGHLRKGRSPETIS